MRHNIRAGHVTGFSIVTNDNVNNATTYIPSHPSHQRIFIEISSLFVLTLNFIFYTVFLGTKYWLLSIIQHHIMMYLSHLLLCVTTYVLEASCMQGRNIYIKLMEAPHPLPSPIPPPSRLLLSQVPCKISYGILFTLHFTANTLAQKYSESPHTNRAGHAEK